MMWFDTNIAIWIGALGGSAFGIWGGLLGMFSQSCAKKGKHRKLITGLICGTFVVGIVALVFGLVALISGQPYHIWYPLTLIGGIICFVLPCMYHTASKIYNQAELNKMQLQDMDESDSIPQ